MARPRKYFTEEEAKAAQRAQHRVSSAKWRQNNPDKIAENKEDKKVYDAQRYQANRDKILPQQAARNAEYRTTLSGMCANKSHSYRATDRKRFGTDECSVTTEQMKEMIELHPYCFYCGETDFLKLGLDRIDNSKPHTVDNCVVACWNCNKHRHTIPFKEFCNKKGLTV